MRRAAFIWFFFALILGACSAPSGSLLPQASLPPPDYQDEGGITVSAPDANGVVTISAGEDSVPQDGTVIITVGSTNAGISSDDDEDEDASDENGGCYDKISQCPQLDSKNRCQQIPDADGSFTTTVSATVAATITVAIVDQHSCSEVKEYKVEVQETETKVTEPENTSSIPELPLTTEPTDVTLEDYAYNEMDEGSSSTGVVITSDSDSASNDDTTASSDAGDTSGTGDNSAPTTDGNGSEVSPGSPGSADTETSSGEPTAEEPASEEPAPEPEIRLVETVFHPRNIDRYNNPVIGLQQLNGLYLSTIVLPENKQTSGKLVTFKGTALMRVHINGVDPGLRFSASEILNVYTCEPRVKPDLVYDRAFIVRNAIIGLWQGAELFIADNYNPTRQPPDVPTRLLNLYEISKRLGLSGVHQIRVIPYVDSFRNELVMVVGSQLPGGPMRYSLITAERRSGYCGGIIPTSVTYIAEANGPVQVLALTEKYSDGKLIPIIRVDDPESATAYFVSLDTLEVEEGDIPAFMPLPPLKSSAPVVP